jgi:hypothetical protein
MTAVFEGSIIRGMRRLEELLRQMSAASKSIGNTELENKFAEGKFYIYPFFLSLTSHPQQELQRLNEISYLQTVCIYKMFMLRCV